MPTVSVLMVFHRDGPYLRPAIASVLNQTWRDLELVLVDNGTGLAADGLGELGGDPRLRWVRMPTNLGIPGGHNAGVTAAKGAFIALQDYDDVALPARIERQVAAFHGNPSLGLVSALAERIDEHERVIGHMFCLPNPAEHRAYAPYAGPVIMPVAMVRAEVLRAYPYRGEFPFAADLDFQARIVGPCRMAVLPDVLLRYRWYATQTTQQRLGSIEQSRCVIQILAGRRSAGVAEDMAGALAETAASSPAETWRRGARVCLRDRFPVFAAYQSRRSLAVDRSVNGMTQAVRLAWAAWAQAKGAERRLAARMFLSGPVRALRLHPA